MDTISRDQLEHVVGGVTININLGDLLQQLMQAQGAQAAAPQDPTAMAQPAAGPPQAAGPQPQGQGAAGMIGNIGNLISMFSGMFSGGGAAGGQGGAGMTG